VDQLSRLFNVPSSTIRNYGAGPWSINRVHEWLRGARCRLNKDAVAEFRRRVPFEWPAFARPPGHWSQWEVGDGCSYGEFLDTFCAQLEQAVYMSRPDDDQLDRLLEALYDKPHLKTWKDFPRLPAEFADFQQVLDHFYYTDEIPLDLVFKFSTFTRIDNFQRSIIAACRRTNLQLAVRDGTVSVSDLRAILECGIPSLSQVRTVLASYVPPTPFQITDSLIADAAKARKLVWSAMCDFYMRCDVLFRAHQYPIDPPDIYSNDACPCCNTRVWGNVDHSTALLKCCNFPVRYF
jgi:hypothetical protein